MSDKQGSWGGYREGAGAKSKWHTEGGTKLVRVPVAIENNILEAARAIDAGVKLIPAHLQHEPVTESSHDEYVTKSSYDELVTQSSEEVKRLKTELEQMRQERDCLQQELAKSQAKDQSEQLPDYEALRDRVLAELKLGSQASGYKAAAKVLNRFITFVSQA